jgi:hypothetical protein
VDPLQHKYPHYTPYQYAGNKPVSYIDLDGLEEAEALNNTIIEYYSPEGKWIGKSGIDESENTVKVNAIVKDRSVKLIVK